MKPDPGGCGHLGIYRIAVEQDRVVSWFDCLVGMKKVDEKSVKRASLLVEGIVTGMTSSRNLPFMQVTETPNCIYLIMISATPVAVDPVIRTEIDHAERPAG